MSSDLFPTLGLPMYRGRGFNEDEDRPGAPLVFEGKPYTIVGVAAPAIQLPGAPDIYTLLGQETDPRMQNREIHPGIQVWGRLRPGVTPQQAGLELGLIGRRLEAQYPKSNAGRTSVARPLRPNVGDVGSTLWLLLGGVSLGETVVDSGSRRRPVRNRRRRRPRAALGPRQRRSGARAHP